jgi:uncharacterized protein (DUF1800 family)
MAANWSYENAAHLLKRCGFGGAPEEIQAFFDRHDDVASAVEELLGFSPSSKKPPLRKDDSEVSKRKQQSWWIKTMAKARKPADMCREKLVVFYHNFLVSGASKQRELRFMAYQNRLFRMMGKGNFRELLREFNRDPANLYYLDGILNDFRDAKKGIANVPVVNANENFGRELMELFSLGPFQFAADGLDDPAKPNYTEDDVHQLSRALSGWVRIEGELGVWNQNAWDGGRGDDSKPPDGVPDPVTIFGVTNDNFRIGPDDALNPLPPPQEDDVLRLLLELQDDDGNRQAAMFVARKFWEWYAYPAPAPGLKALLAQFAATLYANDYEIEPMLREMWTHEEFFSIAAKTRSVKSPVEYVIQVFKALRVKTNGKYVGDPKERGNIELGVHLAQMGMDLFEPPNVAGWPGGLRWITSSTLLERLEFVKNLTASDKVSRIRGNSLKQLQFTGIRPAEDVVDEVIAQLSLDVGPLALTSVERDLLIAYATDDGVNPTLDLSSDTTDDFRSKVRGIIGLALQAAEFHVH